MPTKLKGNSQIIDLIFWGVAFCGLGFVTIGLLLQKLGILGILLAPIMGGFTFYAMLHALGLISGLLKVGPPQVTLSKDTLAIGDTFSVNLCQLVKRPVTIDHLVIQLVEFRNTRSVTDQHGGEIQFKVSGAFTHPGGKYLGNEMIDISCTLDIPQDAYPSFTAKNIPWFSRELYKVDWFIRVEIVFADIFGIPTDQLSFLANWLVYRRAYKITVVSAQ